MACDSEDWELVEEDGIRDSGWVYITMAEPEQIKKKLSLATEASVDDNLNALEARAQAMIERAKVAAARALDRVAISTANSEVNTNTVRQTRRNEKDSQQPRVQFVPSWRREIAEDRPCSRRPKRDVRRTSNPDAIRVRRSHCTRGLDRMPRYELSDSPSSTAAAHNERLEIR